MCQRINGSAQDELLALLSSPQMTGALESSNVEAVSQLCLLRDRCDSLQNFQALQDWLAEFIAVEVPKDGNCGAWSVQALINGNPFQQPRAEDNIKLRNEIAALWLKVSSDILWQSIFFEIVCPFDRVVDEDDLPMIVSEKIVPKKEPKIEPGPARRAKPRPTIFMDLSSPPRAQVEQVGASRPVFTRKTHRDDLRSEQAPPIGHTLRDEAAKLLGERLDQGPQQDPAEGEDEDDGDGEEEAPVTRKRRKRTCQKTV